MIRYARRKKKKDLFVLWLGLSTMCFGIAGATLKGVSAVKLAPILIADGPVSIPVSFVSLPDGIGGGREIDQPAAVGETVSPFESEYPLELPLPDALPEDDLNHLDNLPEPEEMPEPPVEPVAKEIEPEPVSDTPPEPEPAPEKPMEETKPKPEPRPERKVEAKPPTPRKTTPKPTPKKKVSPPKPKPKAQPAPTPRATPIASRGGKLAAPPKVLWRPNLRKPRGVNWSGRSSLVLNVRVGTNGRASSISIARGSGYRALDAEAVAAVRAWRFEPAKNVFGKPMAKTIQVPVDFGYAP